jgi:hypothetical protein
MPAAISMEVPQNNSSLSFDVKAFQAKAAGSASVETTTQSCAQALYSATQQLWISIEVLGHLLFQPSHQTGENLEIAYTIFAEAACNWEKTYQSFTGSGGQPDSVSEAIDKAINQTLPDGQTLDQLCTEVAGNPALWENLKQGMSNQTLNSLFEETDAWIDADGSAGSVGFDPTLTNPSNYQFVDYISDLLDRLQNSPTLRNDKYILRDVVAINDFFLDSSGQVGPICNCIDNLINTPFFEYGGKSYSLFDISYGAIRIGDDLSSEQIQAIENAFNSCRTVLEMYLNLAIGYTNLHPSILR